LGSKFHRIVEDQFIQGGDFVFGNGTGGESIYGETFRDENFQRRHTCAGLLSMANRGRNTNSSQFFITLKACPHLDGKHVVFGQIIEGMEVARKIAKVPTNMNEKPKIQVTIYKCGDEDERRLHIIEDPFKDAMMQITKERINDEKVKVLEPSDVDNYKKKLKKSAFKMLQDYSDSEEEIMNFSKNKRNELRVEEER